MPVTDDFNGKRITVMGLGRFGGGAGAIRFLAARAARVLVTDAAPSESLEDALEPIRDLVDSGAVELRLGAHQERDFTETDLVVANPAVPRPWSNRYLQAARSANVPITTEIGLLLGRLPSRTRVIALTGTAGKSTTAAMTAHALRRLARPGESVHLGGNIGGSLLNELDRITPQDWIVLELSSFMLHWQAEAPSAGAWPVHIAALTNFAPNHLDWHESENHYLRSKAALFRAQRPGDIAIFPDEATATKFTEGPADRLLVDTAPSAPPILLPGAHNERNARLALRIVAAATGAAPDDPTLHSALADFPGLPHRLQLVAERRIHPGAAPIRFFNDSKCTTPEAALLAIEAFEPPHGPGADRVHLIAGGYDKGADLRPISALAPRLAGLYTIGATGPALAQAAPRAHRAAVHHCETLERAVTTAWSAARPGDTILLSPACASWDQFTNFEQRGEAFTTLTRTTIPISPQPDAKAEPPKPREQPKPTQKIDAEAEPSKPRKQPKPTQKTDAEAESSKPRKQPKPTQKTDAEAESSKPRKQPKPTQKTDAEAESSKPRKQPKPTQKTDAEAESSKPRKQPKPTQKTDAEAESSKPRKQPKPTQKTDAEAEPPKPRSPPP
ncbi:MAG: UDP-N-acetylmuramoyl-L-alanine--D-glutamate ligase [Phycisphaeraceae bacterium]|nr:MAG: UDP-N-acetylmuramoyl-L-alanine--D-glutamate ligase [Phycisphaeraceae bacterium]